MKNEEEPTYAPKRTTSPMKGSRAFRGVRFVGGVVVVDGWCLPRARFLLGVDVGCLVD